MTQVTSVASYAAARAIDGATLTDGDLRYIEARATPSDGGAGYFFWNSSSADADNDGTVLKLTNTATGRLVRDRSNVVNVQWFGATGDGTTDDAASVQSAVDAMVDGNILLFPPATYLMEGYQNHPHPNNAASGIAALFDGLNEIAVLGFGATLKQVTTNSVQGVLQFHNCNNVRALGFHLDGVYDSGTGVQSGTLYRASGDCDGLTFEGTIDGGNALAVFDEASGANLTNDKPKNTEVRGLARNAQYGLNYIHTDAGHTFDVVVDTVLRGIFFVGVKSCVGKIAARGVTGSVLNFSLRAGDVVEDVDVTLVGQGVASPLRLKVSDTTECAIRRLRVSGTAELSGGVGIDIQGLGNAATVFEDLDFSDLTIRATSVSSRGECVKLPNNALGTLQRLTLPRNLATNVAGRSAVDLTHGGLTVADVVVPQGWHYERVAAGSSGILIKAASAISGMNVGAGDGVYSGTTVNPLNLSGVTNLRIADVRIQGGGIAYPTTARRTVPVEELVITGSGSPVSSVTPAFVGQRYQDTATASPLKIYEAVGTSASQWEVLN